MSELAVDNRLVLSGSLSKAPEIRYSPAGVPIARFTLQHQSRQQQAEMPRQVVCNILVIASGEGLKRVVEQLNVGTLVRVSGFISRAGYRDDANRIVLNAQHIEMLPTPV